MQIVLENASKRFINNWIFKNVNYTFQPKTHVAILGKNGTGKSTLIKVLSGYSSLSEGKIIYKINNSIIPLNSIYKHLSIVSPHMQLIEEYTILEQISLHIKLKPPVNSYTPQQIVSLIGLESATNRPIKDLSSGMKQRVKLGLAFYCESSIILLDEPCTNLDNESKNWYKENILKLSEKIIIVASNHNDSEIISCRESISL